MTVVIGVAIVAVVAWGVATVTVATGVLTVTVAATPAATDETGSVGSVSPELDVAVGSEADDGDPAADVDAVAGDEPADAGEPCVDARLAVTAEPCVVAE